MKRNVIIAVATVTAVVGGGSLAAVALGSDAGQGGRTEQVSTRAVVAADGGGQDDGQDDGPNDQQGAPQGEVQDDLRADDQQGDQDDAGSTTTVSAARRAVETAAGTVSGVVTDVERDDDDGAAGTWEVGVWGDDDQWHRLRVSKDGTQVLNTRLADGDDGDDDLSDAELASLVNGDALLIGEAVRIAEDHTGAALREAEFDDDGRWHVELRGADGMEFELDIDPLTGAIDEVEREQRGDDRDDGAQDDAGGDDRGDDHGDDDGAQDDAGGGVVGDDGDVGDDDGGADDRDDDGAQDDRNDDD